MTEKELEIIYHQHSNQVLHWMIENLEKGTLADLGSGNNFYVNALRYFGFDAWGYDITNLHSAFQITWDCTESMKLDVDYILCLEVGEHVPKELEGNLFDNICQAKKAVILSWAQPEQEGIGHINCKNPDEVIKEMKSRGFKVNDKNTQDLREANKSSHCNWLTKNITYYAR